MKRINIREALLELDRKTDCRYDLTTLYEACKLDDDDKNKLVKYIDAYDHPATINKFLTSKCDAISEGLADDDVSDMKIVDEINDGGDRTLWNLMDKFEDEDLQLKDLTEDVDDIDPEVLQGRLDDINYAMNTYAKDSMFIDDVQGSGKDWKVTYNDVTVDVTFDTDWEEYTYYINGKGPYCHSSYEYIVSDIMNFVDYNHLGQSDEEVDEALGDNRDVHTRTHMDNYDIYCTDCGQVTSHRFKGNFKDGNKELGRYICKECGCENDDDPINESLTEDVHTSNLEPQIKDVVSAVMQDNGYRADEIEDYTAIEIKDTADNMVQVEVRAELGYDDLMELCDKLNPIVAAIDAKAYFEPVTTGIARAFIRKDQSGDIVDEEVLNQWTNKIYDCASMDDLRQVYITFKDHIDNGQYTDGTVDAVLDEIHKKADMLNESLTEDANESKLTLNESDDTDILYDMEDWDEDNTTVSIGNSFIEDGHTWTWFKQCGESVHLDFDNWAVWWAYRPETEDDMDSPAVSGFFVVDTDTGFIDWGPCDTVKEAQEFLQSKVDDYNNDELNESKPVKESYGEDEVYNLFNWLQTYNGGRLWDSFTVEFEEVEDEDLDPADIINWLQSYDEDAYYDLMGSELYESKSIKEDALDDFGVSKSDAATISKRLPNSKFYINDNKYVFGRDLLDYIDEDEIISYSQYINSDNIRVLDSYRVNGRTTTESKSIKEDVNSAANSLFDLLKDYGAISVDNDVDVTRISFRNSEDDSDATLVHHCILSKGFKELNQYGNNPNVTEYINEAGDTCVKLLIYDDSIAVEVSAEDASQYMNVDESIKEAMTPSQATLDDCLQDYKANAFGFDGVEDYVETNYPSHPQEFKDAIINHLKGKNESLKEDTSSVTDDDVIDSILELDDFELDTGVRGSHIAALSQKPDWNGEAGLLEVTCYNNKVSVDSFANGRREFIYKTTVNTEEELQELVEKVKQIQAEQLAVYDANESEHYINSYKYKQRMATESNNEI